MPAVSFKQEYAQFRLQLGMCARYRSVGRLGAAPLPFFHASCTHHSQKDSGATRFHILPTEMTGLQHDMDPSQTGIGELHPLQRVWNRSSSMPSRPLVYGTLLKSLDTRSNTAPSTQRRSLAIQERPLQKSTTSRRQQSLLTSPRHWSSSPAWSLTVVRLPKPVANCLSRAQEKL